MSLNKFTNTSTGFDIELDIGCDELKANNITTDNIDANTINSQLPSTYSTYVPNFTIDEGGLITESPDISVTSIDDALYLNGNVKIILPNNGATFFTIGFDIPGTYTVDPIDRFCILSGADLDPSAAYLLGKFISGPDISGTPARYNISVRRSDGGVFNAGANQARLDFTVVLQSDEP